MSVQHFPDKTYVEEASWIEIVPSICYLVLLIFTINHQQEAPKSHQFCFMMVINEDLSAYFSHSYRPELLMIKSVNSPSFPLLISWLEIKK